MDEYINPLWSLQAVEYYSAKKRTEALTLTTAWIDLEHMVLSRRSQTQKTT